MLFLYFVEDISDNKVQGHSDNSFQSELIFIHGLFLAYVLKNKQENLLS